MIPCRDCPQRYIGQTTKKIGTGITEHKNAIKRYDLIGLFPLHIHVTTEQPGQAQTKHAREFKEHGSAWTITQSTYTLTFQ